MEHRPGERHATMHSPPHGQAITAREKVKWRYLGAVSHGIGGRGWKETRRGACTLSPEQEEEIYDNT